MGYRLLLLLGALSWMGLSSCAGLIVGGAATGVAVVHDRRTTGTIVEDQSIEIRIYSQIRASEALVSEENNISVTSYNNVVLLTGEVVSESVLQEVQHIASNDPKVKYVHNELMIANPSSLASRSNDLFITTKVKTSLFQINNIPGFDPTRVKVVTEQGVVYLFGLLQLQEADAVTNVARRVDGVQKVVKLFEYIAA